ncbi:MAG: putative ATPase [Parachlamydiales bacterium]|nr:putative ATPase [Parachlamydiales bacterium]
MEYIPRFLKPPKESFFLFGPRGTGKSTWLQHTYLKHLRIDLLDAEEERKFQARPEKLKEIARALSPGDVCIIDEVQRAPQLIPVIHSLIEEKCGIQFILTGSSARKFRRSVGDLLGGRALMRHMGPFIASELKDTFSMEKALRYGLLPMVWQSQDPEEKARNYVAVYLKEEVQAEGIVRQIGDFARFMEVASFSHGALWSSTEIARESQVKRQTVDNYLQILQDLLLAFVVPVFTRRAQRALVSHSKFYYFDAGIFRALRPKGPMDSERELEGAALEGLVAQHLQAWVFAQKENHQFCFWRTQSKLEVDFIVYGPKGFFAIEVKSGQDVSPSDVKTLGIFKEEYPEATCLLLYGGNRRLKVRDILCIPVEEFLRNLTPDQFLF